MWKRFWDWLCSWWTKKPVEMERLDVYQPKERLIFHYFDGKEVVAEDPICLFKRMAEVLPDLEADIKISRAPFKDALQVHGKAVDRMRYIFGVKSLREGGLTDLEVPELFVRFNQYCEELKKNSSYFPTIPMATSPSTESSSEEKSPTPSSSDSGSTENATNSDVPLPSNTESESVLASSSPV